ncbi:MAG: RNA-binding S4 domain-containing protein [Salibacteraceae bacterium]|nr:RNA-binding S4 domain-containing protein [Salibacteraceae bacterium]|tara:strand:- start:9544 stop:9747 length:204 start_codon:yes stop_codon:yes gene_type:complete
MEFELTTEYIELNKLLKLLGWVESGGFANMVISEGLVAVNGDTETRKRKKLRAGETVEFKGKKVTIK